MHEEKATAYRRERERKEKSLRKEAYITHLQEEEKQRRNHKQEVIEKLVSSMILSVDTDWLGTFRLTGRSGH